jgi:plasmid stabilization system protein ParE
MTSNTRLIVSPEAQLDIDDILIFTLERWDEIQKDRYQAVLESAFDRLRAFPELGKDTGRGIREFPAAQHILLYRYDGDTVTILRVIHPRRLRRI